jgi:cation transport ATPase
MTADAPKPEKPPAPEQKHDLSSAELTKSYVYSLCLSLPTLAAVIYLTQFRVEWWSVQVVFSMILFVSIINFIALVTLEEYRSRLGSFTIPVLLASCGLVVLFALIGGVNRFYPGVGYHWLFPVVALVIIFKYMAMFKERNLALKFYLAINIIALAALWGLGKADKIALPF